MLTHIDDKSAEDYLSHALSNLLIKFPLGGYALLGDCIEIYSMPRGTMKTNGKDIFVCSNFVKEIGKQDCQFVLLHEFLHIFYNHPERCMGRDAKVWNIAIDIFTNMEVSEVLETPVPEHGIQPPSWARGMTCEEIYDELIKGGWQPPQPPPPPGGEEGDENEFGEGSDIMEQEWEPGEKQKWQDRFTKSLMVAKQLAENQARGKYTDSIRSRLGQIAKERVPWDRLLRAQLYQELGFDEATYTRPKKQHYPRVILPTYRSNKARKLLLGVDVSASVGEELMKKFIGSVSGAANRAHETHVVTFDQVVREHVRTQRPKDILKKVKFMAGGHSYTSALGYFEIADKVKPDAMAMLTDGYIEVPSSAYKKTIFVIPKGGGKLPWGTTFVMDHDWIW